MADVSIAQIRRLVDGLLERGYTQASTQVLGAIARNHSSGLMGQRLAELQAEAQRLAEAGEALDANNPILRAFTADLESALKRDGVLVDAVSSDVQGAGTDAAGILSRQLALPGLNDTELAALGIRWNNPDPDAIARLVNYVNTSSWQAKIEAFGGDALDVIQSRIIAGIASGQSPLAIARDVRALNGNLPLYQANQLLRTLQLTSYRDATSLYALANADIAEEQIRIGEIYDDRICLACLALHGTPMEIGERVDDHENGRCTSILIVKGREWDITSGSDYYASLNETQQRALAGDANFEALRSGKAQLQDFVHHYQDDTFGSMLREASLKGILGDAAKDFYKAGMQ